MIATTLTSPLFLSPRTIDAVRRLQRSEAWRVQGLLLLSAISFLLAFQGSGHEHPAIRVSGVVAGGILGVLWAFRCVALERRSYRFKQLPAEQAEALLRMAAEHEALLPHLDNLRAVGRRPVGDDEYQLVLLEPTFAIRWQDYRRKLARGILPV
jgi:Flp pilus assembly protein TadB